MKDIKINGTVEDIKPKKKSGKGVLILGVTLLALVASGILTYNYFTVGSRIPHSMLTDGAAATEVAVSTEAGRLYSIIKKAAVNLRTSQIEVDLTQYPYVYNYDAMDDYLFLSASSVDGNEEIMGYISHEPIKISEKISEEDAIEALNSVNSYVKEEISEFETGVTVETLKSFYKECFIYTAWSHVKDLEGSSIKKLESIFRHTKDGIGDKLITFEGIGTRNLNDLDIFVGKPGILYNGTDGIIHLYDGEADYTVAYITHNGNYKLNNDPMKLAPVPDFNNVYVDIGWKSAAEWGYGTFAVMTESGMYTFKITESIEDPVGTATKIIEWLGIDKDAPVIDIGYDLIFTVADMVPPYIPEA